MSGGKLLLLLAAGIGGGLSGSIAGVASLFTYPALLAAGLSPIAANVTNTVSVVFNGLGYAAGSRPELRGQGRRLLMLLPAAALGGLVGGVLLLKTPEGGFERLVPWLLGLAAVTILLPPRRVTRGASRSRRQPLIVVTGVLLIALYGGYFGAAAGVLMLALLLVAEGDPLPVANAIKNLALCVANGVAAVEFSFAAPVHWKAMVPLAVGGAIGSRIGPIVIRRAPVRPLRIGIALVGLVLAVWLAFDAYG